jgi:mono/diheme cytochrome c family protein
VPCAVRSCALEVFLLDRRGTVKRVVKWTAIVLASIVVVALIAIYGVSEYRLRQTFDIAAAPIPVPNDSASLAHGRHVFLTRGCQGCHGEGTKGKVFFDEKWIARLVAPNVPKAIRGYSDPDLVRLLRHGVRPTGRGVAVMPSSMFYYLDDEDLGALVAYLRTVPVKSDSLPGTTLRVLARVGLLTGQYKLEPLTFVHDAPRPLKGPEPAALGEYTARSSCTECHGMKFQGGDGTPALSIVAGYSPAEFAKLMREGVPKDARKLEMMGPTARNRFSHFTDDEVSGLYAFLSRQVASVGKPAS